MTPTNNTQRATVRRPRSRYAAAATLAALLAGLTTTPGSAQSADQAGGSAQQSNQTTDTPGVTRHHVTLITGDRVTVEKDPAGRAAVSVKPAEGREHIKFVKQQDGDHWTVIPADALPLLATGRLDRALFDVSALVKEKYADRASLPLIVEYAGDADTVERRLTSAGAGKVDAIPGTSFATLGEGRENAAEFWDSIGPAKVGASSFGAGIRRVWLDGRAKVSLDRTVPHIGAPQAWAQGYKGEGVKVAVLDTGYDPNHPDLKGLIADAKNFTTEANTDDLHGHGTHVTSTVAGSGAASDGRLKGVAPGVRILSGKVCDAHGSCDNSDIMEGMAWAAQNGAKVINLSLGDVDTPGTDALEALVETVTRDYGVLVVVAAGNEATQPVSSPASADSALAVGAIQVEDDDLAVFTSPGPRVGDFGLKPDISAPGVGVVAARAGGTTAEDGYWEMSGTSMATPHVAGAAAILFQQHPDWTADQVKRQLMQSTSGGLERGAYFQGAGRVDIARAVSQQVTAEPTGLDYGQIRWSDNGRPPVKKTITYRNPGSEPVTLDLSLQVTYEKDAPAPDGMFRLGADKVTVPAHGTADVTVTATPETATEHTAYSGVVIASTPDEKVSVRVPLGMDVEQPSRSLRITMKDRSGKAPDYAYLHLHTDGREAQWRELLGTGSTELRLPIGQTFSLSGLFFDEAFTEGTMVGAPEFVMNTDRDIILDARRAHPVEVSAPSRSARIALAEFGTIGHSGLLFSVFANGSIGSDHVEGLYATPTAQVKDAKYTYLVNTIWHEPGGVGPNAPTYYYLTRPVSGGIPADPSYRPRKSDLAEVNTTFAATAAGTTAYRAVWMHLGNLRFYHGLTGLPVPHRRVDYFSTAESLRWMTVFDQNLLEAPDVRGQFFMSTMHGYKAGTKVEEHWNNGVQAVGFSPSMSHAYRDGDYLSLSVQNAANKDLHQYAHTSASSQQTWEVRRNGKPVTLTGNSGQLPADRTPADYQLTFRQERDLDPQSSISTALRAEWQFRSQTTDGQRALPLYAVRMSPELDEWNRAEDGRKFDIPVLIQRQPGATGSSVRTFTTQVSYDEGRTWHSAKVKGSGDNRTVTVHHPHRSADGSVSLRTYVKDAAGNSFKQTVIRAYLLK
ncbi:S8 family serine peptidase [Streptomyces sp. NPDC086077]|uniref:S8 family peptidase n=1 Tax=Streptomyces sp. NPDC086077 TaxID=3154862 RepID=UPI003437CE5E